jgi:ABC-type branched-subunit amino acid transport system ATPase component
MSEPLLSLQGVSAGYRKGVLAIRDVHLEIPEGDAVGVVGMNGAGKSTLLKAISGLLPIAAGSCAFAGEDLAGRGLAAVSSASRARRGLVLLPEGHRVIGKLTVRQNLLLAAHALTARRSARVVAQHEELIYELFPILQERAGQMAGLLSGGEQQMLSLSRALITGPRLLILDEPSLGLAPVVVDRIYEALAELRNNGLSMLVVEQNDVHLRGLCNRLIVISDGTKVLEGTSSELSAAAVESAYFGVASTATRIG